MAKASAETSSFALYKRVLAYLSPYRAQFFAALVCMVLYGASDGVIPFLVKYVLDEVFNQQNRSLLYVLPAALVVFAILRALFDFGQQYLMARTGHYIVRDIRNQVNQRLLQLSPDFFLRTSSGDLIARITSDVLLVRTFLTDAVAAVMRDAIRVVALLIAAVYLDPLLALLAFVIFPIGVYPVYRFGRRLRKLSRQGQEAIGSVSAMLQESTAGNRVVKIFGREKYEQERFQLQNEKLSSTFIKSEKVRAISGPINEVLASFAISGIILYGGYSVIHGVRSQGDFIAFLLSVFLLYDPFKKLSRVNGTIQQGMASSERIFEILDTLPSVKDPEQPLRLPASNRIEFENVSFSYPKSEQRALSNINLDIQEGNKVAFVGFSGAGKSTLMDMLPRFADPQQGCVRIGGTDISRVSLAELRSRIAMVGQHTFLFNDSVFNNIAYGMPGATLDQVVAAAKAAYAYEFIMALPKQFDTVLGESGLSLSGGERQRIAIARAILKNAPILILDEATASLDNRSEREVQSALEVLAQNRTTLVIAHRLSTVQNADRIVVMRDGGIVESGTHQELLKNSEGEYARLHALQFAEVPADSEDTDEVLLN